MKKIAIVLGTRPEIIKLAELTRQLKASKEAETALVFTGQHYDHNLCQVFMQELRLPKIDINLGISQGSNAEQVSAMVKKLSQFISKNGPEVVVAEGDTNSVLAAALASFYCKTRFAHVEAGLRSFDWRMPEETNRVIADKLSHYAFAPTETAVKNLEKSGCKREAIHLTGNTIVEAVQKNMRKTKNSKILEKLGLKLESYAVLTAHRQEYVDKKENLEQLLSAVEKIGVEIVFPAHPRTVKNLEKFGLMQKAKKISNLHFIEPVGYFDFLLLASNSMFLLSDSGGVQEEASVYKKFVVVLRDKTERPEILGSFGCLAGYNEEKIVRESNNLIENYSKMKRKLTGLACPFGDGKASEKIARILTRK